MDKIDRLEGDGLTPPAMPSADELQEADEVRQRLEATGGGSLAGGPPAAARPTPKPGRVSERVKRLLRGGPNDGAGLEPLQTAPSSPDLPASTPMPSFLLYADAAEISHRRTGLR